ncbi:MAG: nucleoside deaminase [Deltaproteobacteria bacterium]|nr:nucleoside deaminase [Deltaproteobacteria bacterium]
MRRKDIDRQYIDQALELAGQAAAAGEVPVGAVVVKDQTVIGRGYNLRERDCDPTAHAEIVAMRQAAQALGHWRLSDCRLYVTLEPCPMCAGALVNARVSALIYGCADPKAGAVRSLYTLCDDPRLNHRLAITRGVEAERCAALLADFFEQLRAAGEK